MDDFLRALGLLLFAVTVTWLVSIVLGRLVARRGFMIWVGDRSGMLGRVLLALGLALAGFGLSQGGATGSSLVVLGSLLGMAGLWLILPGP